MRNLKKILALVLALVMSLSLMATASAADTTAETGSKYQEAVDVLTGLKVVQGDEGTGDLRLGESISRAEVAALMYRIATGDAAANEVKNYTGSTFKDVKDTDWYAPYVTYCYIAEIIKGEPGGAFKPDDEINGYATLAMILRALGYGKNGEFVGEGWEVRTASTAKQIGVLDGISDAALSGDATRELVFEILYRALMKDMVEFDAMKPYQYPSKGTTLGYEMFGLEQVTGVIKANQWANLEGLKVLADDTTKMDVTSTVPANNAQVGKSFTLNVATDLEAVGMTYTAVMATKDGVKVLTDLVPVGNNVADNEGARTTNISGLAASKGMSLDDETEYYLNYDPYFVDNATSKWQVRYAVAKDSVAAKTDWAAYIAQVHTEAGHTRTERELLANWDVNKDGKVDTKDTIDCWVVSIRIGAVITSEDLAIIYAIFDTADKIGDTTDKIAILPDNTYAIGEVYVGTSSLEDKSDIMAWVDFDEEYLDHKDKQLYDIVERGNSMRIIDNDGNGYADYVLKVTYTQDKAIGTYKDDLEFNSTYAAGWDTRYDDEVVVGDVVNYTQIDGVMTVYKADMITDTIHNKNFRNSTVTPTSETDPRYQSEIDVYTGMFEDIMVMDEKVEYNIYFDEYGHIRSYELTADHQYALLTELYGSGTMAHNYLNTRTYTAEVKVADEAIREYTVLNSNPFISTYNNDLNAWTSRSGRYSTGDYNFLQPAIAHLGKVLPAGIGSSTTAGINLTNANFAGGTTNYAYSDWNRAVYQMAPVGGPYGVFNYGPVAGKTYNDTGINTPVSSSFSFTNVAAYVLSDDGVTLNTAARLALDKATSSQIYYGPDAQGNPYGAKKTVAEWAEATGVSTATVENQIGVIYWPVYEVDYIQLDVENVKAGMRHFAIDDKYSDTYHTNSNGYVNANNDTVFYVVTPSVPNGVTYYDSYTKLPTINATDIRATYAVATNTAADADGLDYWVGDVIVIETTGTAAATGYDSISLAYANPYENSGSVQYFNTLNNQWRNYEVDDKANIGVVPNGYGWTNVTNSDFAFYFLSGSEFENGELKAGITRFDPTTQNYSDYGIYAGTIQRTVSIYGSGYIDVDTLGRPYTGTPISDADVIPVDISYAGYEVPFYRVNRWTVDEITFERVNDGGVRAGDEIIWVESKNGDVAYVVDLGARSRTAAERFDYTAPAWLWTVYGDVLADMHTTPAVTTGVVMKTSGLTINTTTVENVEVGKALVIKESALAKAGYTITSVTCTVGGGAGTLTPAGSAPERTWTLAAASVTANTVIEVTVAYAETKYTLAIPALPAGVSVTVKEGATTVAGTPAVGPATGNTYAITEGAAYTIELTITDKYATYTYKVGDSAIENAIANNKIPGTMTADTTITIVKTPFTQDEKNEALDTEIGAGDNGVPNGAADIPSGGTGYTSAYTLLGVEVVGGNPKSTVTVKNTADFLNKLAAPSAAEKQAVKTIQASGAPTIFAAGVTFEMPADTTKVEFTYNVDGGAESGTVTENVGSVTSGSNLVSADGNVYLNMWLTLVEGTFNGSTGGVDGAQLKGDRTVNYTIKVYNASGLIGTIERSVQVVYN